VQLVREGERMMDVGEFYSHGGPPPGPLTREEVLVHVESGALFLVRWYGLFRRVSWHPFTRKRPRGFLFRFRNCTLAGVRKVEVK
jgi:hypothetical protein